MKLYTFIYCFVFFTMKLFMMIAMNKPSISHEEALKSLETVHAFLLQQENAM